MEGKNIQFQRRSSSSVSKYKLHKKSVRLSISIYVNLQFRFYPFSILQFLFLSPYGDRWKVEYKLRHGGSFSFRILFWWSKLNAIRWSIMQKCWLEWDVRESRYTRKYAQVVHETHCSVWDRNNSTRNWQFLFFSFLFFSSLFFFSFLFFFFLFFFLFRFIEGILSIQGSENGGNVASDPVRREKSSQWNSIR